MLWRRSVLTHWGAVSTSLDGRSSQRFWLDSCGSGRLDSFGSGNEVTEMQEFEIHNGDQLIAWQQQQWQGGNRVRIEDLQQRYAWLQDQPDILLDLIYSEVLLR